MRLPCGTSYLLLPNFSGKVMMARLVFLDYISQKAGLLLLHL
jgi:hypothetical protein